METSRAIPIAIEQDQKLYWGKIGNSMSRSEILFSLYGAAGLVVYVGMFISFRKEGSLTFGPKAAKPGVSLWSFGILPLLLEPFLFPLMLLLWPLVLLGILICWLDGKAVGDTDNHRDKNT